MPTGYTAGIADGTTKTFKEYAFQCARAFGALITERDNPITSEIPTLKAGQYYLDRVPEAEKNLTRLTLLTPIKAEAEFKKERSRHIKYYQKMIKEKQETKKRYEKILKYCSKFKPPTEDHINYGAFLISQIEDSIKWDCDTSWYEENLKTVTRSKSWKKWLREKIKSAKQELTYATESLKEEIVRVDSRNQWLQQLMHAVEEVG